MHIPYLFFTIAFLTNIVQLTCPPKTRSNDPYFIIPPPITLSGLDSELLKIHCCVDGYENINWTFRHLNGNWSKIPLDFDILDSSRELILNQPRKDLSDGYYQCFVMDENGKNISTSIFVYFMYRNEVKDITIVTPDVSPNSMFKPGDSVIIKCDGFTYLPETNVSVRWYHQEGQKLLNISRPISIFTKIIRAKDRQLETNPDLVDVVSTLNMENLALSDSGWYICIMEQNHTKVNQTFLVSISKDKINIVVLASAVTTIVVATGLVWLLWYFHDNVIVLCKTYFVILPGSTNKSVDVAFFYMDEDIDSRDTAFLLTKFLEKHHFKCWLYDRDKQYGADFFSSIDLVLRQSHVLLTFINLKQDYMEPLLGNIYPQNTNPSVRRLYVFIPSKKNALQHLKENNQILYRWMKKELRMQSWLSSSSMSCASGSKSAMNKMGLWIIASLPTTAIRQARKSSRNEQI